MSQAWNKYKQTLSGFTPEEEAILRPEYERYLERYASSYNGKDALPKDSLWRVTREKPMSFDDWWRSMADNIKDNREGK